MAFSARPQVGWVLGVMLLLYLGLKLNERTARILIPVTTIGILLGYTATVAMSFEVSTTYIAVAESTIPTSSEPAKVSNASPSKPPVNPSKSSTSTTSPASTTSPMTKLEQNASKLCESNGQEIEVNGFRYSCKFKVEEKTALRIKNPSSVIIDQADSIPYHHEVNKIDASSAIETQKCPNTGDTRFDRYFCIAYRAPGTTFTFLFRPMLGADVTSSSSLFAALENIFWFSAALFVVIMFIRNRRLAFFGVLAPSLLFTSIYIVVAGAYEGNMGTAFRHKSLILWVVILLLASTIVATKERKAEDRGICR